LAKSIIGLEYHWLSLSLA